jgi:nucleotide-binding universal stress UspA family protein
MFRKILLAYDGSEGADTALNAGINLAKIHRAELWALAVQEKLPRFSGTIDEVQEEKQFADEQYGKLLDAAKVRAKTAGIELKTLMAVAKEGKFDLVLVGHSGLSGVWAAFLGTTAEKVSRHAPCSVLIVR